MITGNAAAALSRGENYPLKLTTPAIVTGGQFNVKFAASDTAVLGLFTPSGPFEISLALELMESSK